MDIWECSRNVIWAIVRGAYKFLDWNILGVYGPPNSIDRPGFWDKLRNKVVSSGRPWMLIGDINLIFNVREKQGG